MQENEENFIRKERKTCLLPLVFLRKIHDENFSLEDADQEKSQLINELRNMDKDKVPVQKRSFLNNVELFLIA